MSSWVLILEGKFYLFTLENVLMWTDYLFSSGRARIVSSRWVRRWVYRLSVSCNWIVTKPITLRLKCCMVCRLTRHPNRSVALIPNGKIARLHCESMWLYRWVIWLYTVTSRVLLNYESKFMTDRQPIITVSPLAISLSILSNGREVPLSGEWLKLMILHTTSYYRNLNSDVHEAPVQINISDKSLTSGSL
jgi:hypothetical protein